MALGTKLTVSTLILGTGLIGAYGVANEGFGPVGNGSESDAQIETASPSNAAPNPQQPAAPVVEAEDNEINVQSSTEGSSTLENQEQKEVTGKDPNTDSEPISNHVEEEQTARSATGNTSSRDSALINVIVN